MRHFAVDGDIGLVQKNGAVRTVCRRGDRNGRNTRRFCGTEHLDRCGILSARGNDDHYVIRFNVVAAEHFGGNAGHLLHAA